MNKLDEFISYLNKQVNKAIYVWGAQGQKATPEWIKAKEKDPTHRNAALKLYEKRKAEGINPILAFDCSGLGMYWFENVKEYYKSDKNANGMLATCTKIQAKQLKRGDWVFRTYKSGADKGKAYHIGYVVDDKLNVVHAKGRAYGVVKEKFSSTYWNTYGMPLIFKTEIENQDWHVYRTLYEGRSGADVEGLQKALIAAGYKLPKFGADGDFGEETKTAVIAYQKANKLTPNGKVSKTMVLRLGGMWK